MIEKNKKRSLLDYFKVIIQGFSMGCANIIPGVSGGTMAFIMGIYEELIQSIHEIISVNTIKLALGFKIKEMFDKLPWRFLACIAVGALIATASLAKVLLWLLGKHPALVWAFFFGLVLASILTILKKIKKWGPAPVIGIILGSVAAYLIVGMVPTETPNQWWFLFLSGAIAICAMILPGISGSFLLVLMGKYTVILSAIPPKNIGNLMTLFWVAAGCAIGLATFVQLLSWLFKRFHDLTVAILIGFMVGSLRKIWPWKEVVQWYTDRKGVQKPLIETNILPESFDGNVMLAIGLAIVGFAVVFLMEYVAGDKPEKADAIGNNTVPAND